MYSVTARNVSAASRDDRHRSYLPKALLPGPNLDSCDIPGKNSCFIKNEKSI